MKFKNSFDNKYLIKIDNEPKMHYLIKIFKEKNKKIEFASRELSEDEWQGKTEFDVKLNKAIPSYINSSKKYPMVVVVKAVPNICCEVCHSRKLTRLNTKAQKLHMMPSCKHFIHKKCANERIKKLKNNRKKRSGDEFSEFFRRLEPPPLSFLDGNYQQEVNNGDVEEEKEEINNCSDKELEEEGPSHTSSPIIINNGDRCPVRDCKTFVQLKKHGSGREAVIFNKEVVLFEKKVFEALLVMPILQNGESPEYTYIFEVKHSNIVNKLKNKFIRKSQKNKAEEKEISEEEDIENVIENEAEELNLIRDGRSISRRRRRTRSRIPENLNTETINQETAQNSTNEGNGATEKTNASTSTNGGENKVDETLNQNIANKEKLGR